MNIIEFPEHTTVIAKNQPQYRPMPAYRALDGRVICCWRLTWRERLKVLITGLIWHHILTFNEPLQPQLLEIDKPAMPKRQEVPNGGLAKNLIYGETERGF